jgi:enterochelin esterase-like enzyme
MFVNSTLYTLIMFISLSLSGCEVQKVDRIPPPITESESTIDPLENDSLSQIETIMIDSAALNETIGVDVYLPPGYNEAESYPVLYLFYGYGGNRSAVFDWLRLHEVADDLIESKQVKPTIIVSPDYGNSFGVDTVPGEGRNPGDVDEGNYESYIIDEVIPYIDAHYSTISTREDRFIGGFSMGGYAALYLGINYSDLFSKIGAHSAALWDYSSTDQFAHQRDWLYANEELRNARDPFRLALEKDLTKSQIYLDVGSSDGLAGVNERFHSLLVSKDIPVEWHLNTGNHSMSYWSNHLEDYLLYYSGI